MAAMLFSHVTLTFLLITCLYQPRDVVATVVELTSSLPSIIPKMTSNVTLRCDIKDILLPQSGGLVGRSLPEDIHPVERRDKAQSPNAMQFILSVVMTKDGQDIASMSEHVPARLLGNLTSNGKVTGNLAGSHGYLELSLDYPTRTQTGTYRCDVTGIDSAGHSDVIKSSVNLAQGEVTLDDLVDRLHDLDLQNRQKDLTIQSLKDHIDSNNANHEIELQNLKNQVSTNNSYDEKELQNTRSQMSQMSTNINHLKHVESGILKCDMNSTTWTGRDGSVTYNEKKVVFSKSYPSPPIVHVGIRRYDNYEPSGDYFYLEVQHVDATGFTVRCGKLTRYANLWQLYMTWISLPNV